VVQILVKAIYSHFGQFKNLNSKTLQTVYLHFESNSKTSTQRHRKWLEASHHKLQGAIEVQTVQGAIEVVKRLEIWDEAVGAIFRRGWSVG
jgi:hypothetical protein